MGSENTNTRQPILSLGLLAVLVIITVAILGIHSSYIPPPVPEFLTKPETPSVKSTENSLRLTSPLDYKKTGPLENYSPETLFEKINGKAPLYLESGFIRLQSQRFVHNSNTALWFEVFIYNMTTDLNAFSVFSTQRRPDTGNNPSLKKFRNYITENGIFAQLGHYYVECIGSSTSELLREGMLKTMQSLIAENTLPTSPINELNLFPQQDLNPQSLKLYLANTFGSEALTNTFLCEYTIDDTPPITAFISSQQNSDQAMRVAEAYSRFLTDSGGSPLAGMSGNIKYIDLYGTVESIFQVNTYVGGVHEADDLESARLISERLFKALQEQTQP